MPVILIADDDKMQRLISSRALAQKSDYIIEEVEDGRACVDRLMDTGKPLIDLVLLDLTMPHMGGKEALGRIRESYPTLPVIIVTANNELEDAIEIMRLGASDFITKPFPPERLRVSVEQHLTIRVLSSEVARLTRKGAGREGFSDLVGAEGGLASCVTLGRKAAASDIPVLISGESGTGKELLARAIHGESHRSGRPFVAINCGAIPENLVESTLFGHEKGSFTGAIAREIGKFREAEGGTLLLDEVGELKPDMQTKLLRVLQQKEVQPVGAGKPVAINVRILSATHRNLADDVAAGRFREDLYYRLNVLPIRLPSLAERKGDIPALTEHLLARFCAAEHRKPLTVNPEGIAWLCRQSWPGNIRELENLLYRAVVLTDKEGLDETDFAAMTTSQNASRTQASAEHYVTLIDPSGRAKTWDEIEGEVIAATLYRCGDSVPQAAKLLGMGQSTLYKKLSGKNAA